MTEAWGRWVLETSVVAGLVGILLLVGVKLLRPGPGPRSILLALGLLVFVLPPLVELPGSPLPFGRVTAEIGEAPFLGKALPLLALAQWVGFAAGVLVLGRSAVRLGRIIGHADRIESGPLWESARSVAARMSMPVPALYLTDGRVTASTAFPGRAILLPRREMEDPEWPGLRMILAHETAHLARRDPLAAAIRHLVVALWWFHPVVWALALGHRAAAEDACDDTALSQEHGDPERYCRTLLAWAADVRKARQDAVAEPPASLSTPLGSHPLERRIRRILAGRFSSSSGARERDRKRSGARVLGAAFLTLALLALPVRLVSRDTGPTRGEGVVPTAREDVPGTQRVVKRDRVVIRSARVVAQ